MQISTLTSFVLQLLDKSRQRPRRLHHQSEAHPLPDLLCHVWTYPRQLPRLPLLLGEAPLHRQRHRPAVPPQHVPRHSVQYVRHRRGEGAGSRRRLDPIAPLPSGHHVRPEGATTRQRAALHRAVRAAHQPVQREDLPVSLVLDGLCRDHVLSESPHVGATVHIPHRPFALHQEAPPSHGQDREWRWQETAA